jgi:hypothetical protein
MPLKATRMTDATFKGTLRDLRDDLERLRDDLETAIGNLVGVDEYAESDIITEKHDGSIVVDVAELKALLESLDDAAEAAADAFRKFDQEVDRVWRRFKQALAQHSEVGASQ